jgi:hypothetical protein
MRDIERSLLEKCATAWGKAVLQEQREPSAPLHFCFSV